MHRSRWRAGLVGGTLAMLVLSLAGPASAATSAGGCGTGLTRIAIVDLLAWRPLFPPLYAAAVDTNGNGGLCYQPLPTTMSPSSPEFGHLIVVDDRSRQR